MDISYQFSFLKWMAFSCNYFKKLNCYDISIKG